MIAWLFDFVFYYPLFMAYAWMAGALWYYAHYERHALKVRDPLAQLRSTPLVTVILPCFNEEKNLREVVRCLMALRYPRYEVLAVNDGSVDATGRILEELAREHPRIRIAHHAANQGKAVALNTGCMLARGEYLLCIDGDAVLEPDIIPWMLTHFESAPRVGAVTGNPRIRTRSTLLGRIQVGEFSSIVGLIKRAQRAYGRIFTVSGVVAMFRRTAIVQCGAWSPDMLTEDIDISWRLQTCHWDIRFEPHALCWILMPETLKGLWRQRLRWAMGGCQVIARYARIFSAWRQRRMAPIFVEYLTSVAWAYAMVATIVIFVVGLFVHLPAQWDVALLPRWHGVLLGTTCFLQILVGMYLDRKYDTDLPRNFFWMIWYPMAYWAITTATIVWAVPATLLRPPGKRARWVSPDRGVRTSA